MNLLTQKSLDTVFPVTVTLRSAITLENQAPTLQKSFTWTLRDRFIFPLITSRCLCSKTCYVYRKQYTVCIQYVLWHCYGNIGSSIFLKLRYIWKYWHKVWWRINANKVWGEKKELKIYWHCALNVLWIVDVQRGSETVACMLHNEERICRLECFISIMEQASRTVGCSTFHFDWNYVAEWRFSTINK